MSELPEYITRYWGKAALEDETGDAFAWHPLAYHCLDVAAAMKALLAARPQNVEALAQSSGLSCQEVHQRLLVIAALHDLGKFSEAFQGKVPTLAQELGHPPLSFASGHGALGLALWNKISERSPRPFLDPWMFAAMSHHGTPVRAEPLLRNAFSKKSFSAASSFCEDVCAFFAPLEKREGDNPECWIWQTAGLLILADWIGSNAAWFPYQKPTQSLAAYWEQAQACAQKALRESDLMQAAIAQDFGLETLFSDPKIAPSPLQAWAAKLKPPKEPQLFILEDLTGSGKTEAALLLCHRLMQAGCAEGFYWALPTMATANSLYKRLETTYGALFSCAQTNPSLVLAHSARDLNTSFQLSIGRTYPPALAQEAEDRPSESYCAAFIAENRKKTFLAQIGIGTLDQALLGVLPVRHQALRLAALARRILVVDEAHAYDPYMSKGLEKLLAFQKALGGSSIILSATLPQALRRRFVKAYDGDPCALRETGFPLTTHVCSDLTQEQSHASVRGTRRDLPCRRYDRPQEVMDALLEKAKEGFCGVYIRNTVKDAVEAYTYLRDKWEKTDLFHARFCLGDRLAKEDDVLERFGKRSGPQERKGQILVTTQVVEQSLDVDFDFMATDLCPMDLLIQRAGRLQRHERPERPDPVLWIVGPEASQEVREDWYAGLFRAGQFVYPHAGQLWQTMRSVDQKGGLPLLGASPRELIESVFGGEAPPYPAALDPPSLRAEAKALADSAVAHLNFLSLDSFAPQAGSWEKDVFTPTRLGDKTITIRLAKWEDGRLLPWVKDGREERQRWRLSEISLRAALCKECLAPNALAQEAIRAKRESWQQRYEPPQILALTKKPEAELWSGTILSAQGSPRSVSYDRGCGLVIL